MHERKTAETEKAREDVRAAYAEAKATYAGENLSTVEGHRPTPRV